MREVSTKTKIKEHRGEGEGASYIPWILTREVKGNTGTSTILKDWKHGRQVHLLSQGELWAYYILRWRDDVIDIREQFPLDIEKTIVIADMLGFNHPKDNEHYMTTDLLVTYLHGNKKSFTAYSVKPNNSMLDNRRCVEKLTIERIYWESKGIPFRLIFKDKLNPHLVNNIRDVCTYYDINDCQTEEQLIKHNIAHKLIKVDMTVPIDYSKIA